MPKIFIILLIAFSININGYSQIHNIHQADSLMAISAKPMIILISAKWCKFCSMQEKIILKNQNFKKSSLNFYLIKMDAELQSNIQFGGIIYKYLEVGIHDLAVKLNRSENISFPTIVVMDEKYQILYKNEGVITEKLFNKIILNLSRLN